MKCQQIDAVCSYKSGNCTNPRAIKLNGNLHSLCEYHRNRQNAHQRKSDRKTRLIRASKTPIDSFYPSWPRVFEKQSNNQDSMPIPLIYSTQLNQSVHDSKILDNQLPHESNPPKNHQVHLPKLPSINYLLEHIQWQSN